MPGGDRTERHEQEQRKPDFAQAARADTAGDVHEAVRLSLIEMQLGHGGEYRSVGACPPWKRGRNRDADPLDLGIVLGADDALQRRGAQICHERDFRRVIELLGSARFHDAEEADHVA